MQGTGTSAVRAVISIAVVSIVSMLFVRDFIINSPVSVKLSQSYCNGLVGIRGMIYEILFNKVQFVGGKLTADIFFAFVSVAYKKTIPLPRSVLCRGEHGCFTSAFMACTALADEKALSIGIRIGCG